MKTKNLIRLITITQILSVVAIAATWTNGDLEPMSRVRASLVLGATAAFLFIPKAILKYAR